MKPHRFLTAIFCAMVLIAISGRAYAVEAYNSQISQTAYKRSSLNLDSGYKLPAFSSIKSKPLPRVSFKQQYLQTQKTWTGLSGNVRRNLGEVTPYGAVRHASSLNSYNKNSRYDSRPSWVKINTKRTPYSLP